MPTQKVVYLSMELDFNAILHCTVQGLEWAPKGVLSL